MSTGDLDIAPKWSSSEPSYPNLDSLLEKSEQVFENMVRSLKIIKDALNPTGRPGDAIYTSFLPSFAQSQRVVKTYEEATNTALDWHCLDAWLVIARKHLQQTSTVLRKTVLIMGCDLPNVSGLSPERMQQKLSEAFEKTPMFQACLREYGPRWMTCQERMISLSGLNVLGSNTFIPLRSVRPHIERGVLHIIHRWQELQNMEKEGVIDRFRKRWQTWTPSERCQFVQRLPEIHRCQHADIYQWVQHSNQQLERLDRRAFLTPHLNVVDLSQGCFLPDLLHHRATQHPRFFLPTDSSSVRFGVWCKALQELHIDGRVSFSSGIVHENTAYGIHFEDESMKSPLMENPCLAVHRIEAQKAGYDVFVACLSAELNLPESPFCHELVRVDGLHQQSASVLSQSARSSLEKPGSIDWKLLQNRLTASLDEALTDLWQLRTDADFWRIRMQETPNSGPGRTSNMLRAIFGRIDILDSLCSRFNSLPNKEGLRISFHELASSPLSARIRVLEDAISMHVIFYSSLNEVVSSMQATSWSPKGANNTTFSTLIDLMEKNHPMLRAMGLDAVLGVLEREIEDVKVREVIPFAIMQLLSDLSVLAACERETRKHRSFVPCEASEYFTLAGRSEAQWKQRERPWTSASERTFRLLSSKKLYAAIPGDMPPSEQHRAFWESIDEIWMRERNTDHIVDFILRKAPLVVPCPRVQNAILADWSTTTPQEAISATKIAISKGRRWKASTPKVQSFAVLRAKEPPPPRPLITITDNKLKDFWRAMCGEEGPGLEFDDLCSFLQGAGYTSENQGGAARRFELKKTDGATYSIVFHEQHGTFGRKLPRRLARQWWGDKISGQVDVVLE